MINSAGKDDMRKLIRIITFLIIIGIHFRVSANEFDFNPDISVLNSPADFRVNYFDVNSNGEIAISFDGPEMLVEILVFDVTGKLLSTHKNYINGAYAFKLGDDRSIKIIAKRYDSISHYSDDHEFISKIDYSDNEDEFNDIFHEWRIRLSNIRIINGIEYEVIYGNFEDVVLARNGTEVIEFYRSPEVEIEQRKKERIETMLFNLSVGVFVLLGIFITLRKASKNAGTGRRMRDEFFETLDDSSVMKK